MKVLQWKTNIYKTHRAQVVGLLRTGTIWQSIDLSTLRTLTLITEEYDFGHTWFPHNSFCSNTSHCSERRTLLNFLNYMVQLQYGLLVPCTTNCTTNFGSSLRDWQRKQKRSEWMRLWLAGISPHTILPVTCAYLNKEGLDFNHLSAAGLEQIQGVIIIWKRARKPNVEEKKNSWRRRRGPNESNGLNAYERQWWRYELHYLQSSQLPTLPCSRTGHRWRRGKEVALKDILIFLNGFFFAFFF